MYGFEHAVVVWVPNMPCLKPTLCPAAKFQTDTPGRRDLTPRPAGSVTPRRGQASPAVARGRGLGLEADGQYQLFTAIDAGDIDRVRIELARMGPCTRKSIVLSASNQPAFRFRTPLMAAAESGDFSIFMDVLEACKLVLSWGGPSGLDMVSDAGCAIVNFLVVFVFCGGYLGVLPTLCQFTPRSLHDALT